MSDDDELTASGRDPLSASGRGDAALVCCYALAGGNWVPGKAVDLTNQSHFLAARVVVDEDEDEAFIELRDYPRTAQLEFVVRLRAESRLRRLSGDRDNRSHVYELEKAAGPDVYAFQFGSREGADRFAAAVRRAANVAAERRASFGDADILRKRCVAAGFDEADVREALAAGATSRVAVANYIFDKEEEAARPRRPSLDEGQLKRFERMGFAPEEAAAALEATLGHERVALRRLLVATADGAEAAATAAARRAPATPPRSSTGTSGSTVATSFAPSTATLASSAPTFSSTEPSLAVAGATGRHQPSPRGDSLPALEEESGETPRVSRKPATPAPTRQTKVKPKTGGLAGRLQSLFRSKSRPTPSRRPALPRGTSGKTAELSAAAEAVAAKRATLRPEGAVGFKDFDPLRLLGVGGFGSVLLVRMKADRDRAGQLFALKVMKKATYAKHRLSEHAFFERNLMLVARHPFLVRLRYAFQSAHELYLVTDYFAGGSLEDALKQAPDRAGLGAAAARFVVAELALGLDYLHARDVLHRDIKAANVLLDTTGHAHLCDFGLAKCVEAGGGGGPRRSFAGTVEYMAPELLRKGDEAPSPALDWWALGVLLVETAQGRTPFRAKTPRQLMLNIIREPPQLDRDDPLLRSAVEKLLHKKAAKRLQSAAQLRKRRFFEGLDFDALERKALAPPFRPDVPPLPDRVDGDLARRYGGTTPPTPERPSLQFKGEQFAGFSVFASPAPPVRRKRSDL